MKVLLLMCPFTMDVHSSKFFSVLRMYLYKTNSTCQLEKYDKLEIKTYPLVYSYENAFLTLDHYICYKQHEKKILILRDPVDLVMYRFHWDYKEMDEPFFKDFILRHLPYYANFIKFHSKICDKMIDHDKLYDMEYCMNIFSYIFGDDFNEEIFKSIFPLIPQEPKVDTSSCSQENHQFIQNLFKEMVGFER